MTAVPGAGVGTGGGRRTAPEDGFLVGNDDLAVPVAAHIAAVRSEDLDAGTVAATKRLILDVLGAAVAGVNEPGCVEMRQLVEAWGGTPEATLIGPGRRVPVQNAVAVNATMCRALEIDDVSEVALIHPSATIVPVALAASEALPRTVTGRELLAVVAVATDAHNRLSASPRVPLSGDQYRPRGFSCTYQVGTMISAAIVAKLAGASAGQILSAIGTAYGSAAGNQQSIADHTLGVRIQQGTSAASGVVAAELALRGVRGPHHPLEGRFGYYRMYWHGDYDRSTVLDGLGQRFTVTDVSLKPYPCCKYVHTAVAAAMEVRSDPRFNADLIERIELRVDNAEYRSLVCDPIEEKRTPRTPIEAQFSMPYCVAVALRRGEVTLNDFRPEALANEAVLSLAKKVEIVWSEAELGRKLPTPGHIDLTLRGGDRIVGDADYAPGHPARPFSWDETVLKFLSSVSFPDPRLPADRADALIRRVAHLENDPDIRDLIRAHLVWQ